MERECVIHSSTCVCKMRVLTGPCYFFVCSISPSAPLISLLLFVIHSAAFASVRGPRALCLDQALEAYAFKSFNGSTSVQYPLQAPIPQQVFDQNFLGKHQLPITNVSLDYLFSVELLSDPLSTVLSTSSPCFSRTVALMSGYIHSAGKKETLCSFYLRFLLYTEQSSFHKPTPMPNHNALKVAVSPSLPSQLVIT